MAHRGHGDPARRAAGNPHRDRDQHGPGGRRDRADHFHRRRERGPGAAPSEIFSQPTPALPWNIYNISTEHAAVDEIRHVQFGMVLTLVMVVLLLNLAAIIMRARNLEETPRMKDTRAKRHRRHRGRNRGVKLSERAAAAPGRGENTARRLHVRAERFSVYYAAHEAVRHVDVGIVSGEVTAIIGPSGCGKSTFLRAINRMNDLIPNCRAAS